MKSLSLDSFEFFEGAVMLPHLFQGVLLFMREVVSRAEFRIPFMG